MAVRLTTPLSEKEILKLRAGEIVYLSGVIYTARDLAHMKIIKEGAPFDPRGAVIYHSGPVVRKKENFEIVSAGPTTSARMNKYLDKILDMGVKGIIGKGGMQPESFRKYRAVYFAFTGGAGSLAAKSIRRVVEVYWLEELGIPEAVWVLDVKDFPLIVGIDAFGNSLYSNHR